jgi:predicted DNA-binding transcriptional regulator AlpA
MGAVHNSNEVMQEQLRKKREREEQHRVWLDAVLLTEHDVARITRLSVASIRRRRLLRQEPRFVKLNFSVRYRQKDVEAWIASLPSRGGKLEGR